MNFGDLFTFHYFKKLRTMNFEKGFDAALQNKSYYSLKTTSLEGIPEMFDTLIDRFGITIYVRNASNMYEEIVRPKLEVYQHSRPLRVEYRFKTAQEPKAKPTYILSEDGLSATLGSIMIRIRYDVHFNDVVEGEKDAAEGVKDATCEKDAGLGVKDVGEGIKDVKESVERNYIHLHMDTWTTMKEFAESLEAYDFAQGNSFFFVGYEKDRNTDVPVYEDSLTLAEIHSPYRVYIFSTIPHYEEPLM